jgi:nucleotide-binding universal stress UspA family protein
MFKHILIPTDGSRLSAKAAAAGVEFARAIGARVTALFAAPAPTPIVYENFLPVGYMTPDQHEEMVARAAKRYLGQVEAAAKAAGVPCESVTVTSEYPAETILEVAAKRRCDLIFMASHGRRGVQALLLGSETQKVLAHAKTAVFVYRSR